VGELPFPPPAVSCKCWWTGNTGDLGIEGFCCPKCGEPLFPPEWIDNPPDSAEVSRE